MEPSIFVVQRTDGHAIAFYEATSAGEKKMLSFAKKLAKALQLTLRIVRHRLNVPFFADDMDIEMLYGVVSAAGVFKKDDQSKAVDGDGFIEFY